MHARLLVAQIVSAHRKQRGSAHVRTKWAQHRVALFPWTLPTAALCSLVADAPHSVATATDGTAGTAAGTAGDAASSTASSTNGDAASAATSAAGHAAGHAAAAAWVRAAASEPAPSALETTAARALVDCVWTGTPFVAYSYSLPGLEKCTIVELITCLIAPNYASRFALQQ